MSLWNKGINLVEKWLDSSNILFLMVGLLITSTEYKKFIFIIETNEAYPSSRAVDDGRALRDESSLGFILVKP